MKVFTKVDFNRKVIDWDGFGFNYVETAQTVDYTADPQDYGGFSILSEQQRQEILKLVFGPDGLRPCTIKLFLDPFHQKEGQLNPPGAGKIDQHNYDHETTTGWMRYFAREGQRMTRQQGRGLRFITTLYGPPAFMTRQKLLRGRDLDPAYTEELAKYLAAWVLYLRDKEDIRAEYVSIHNEGEDYHRWPYDGSSANIGTGHDYNLYWTPEQVAAFLPVLGRELKAAGLPDVGATPGETSNWTRFHLWGYAGEIAGRPDAVDALGLITSHGFSGGLIGQPWHGDHRSAGIDLLREKKPALHSWVTSTSWSQMDAQFIYQMHGNIYSAKNNSIIPWAGIQRPTKWVGGDPNPGNAIQIEEDGSYVIRPGYYYYKQVCPVGQAGMYAAETYSTHTATCAIAFAENGSGNPNAFILVNADMEEAAEMDVTVLGSNGNFSAYRTSPDENCAILPGQMLDADTLHYVAPPNSVTTFIQK